MNYWVETPEFTSEMELNIIHLLDGCRFLLADPLAVKMLDSVIDPRPFLRHLENLGWGVETCRAFRYAFILREKYPDAYESAVFHERVMPFIFGDDWFHCPNLNISRWFTLNGSEWANREHWPALLCEFRYKVPDSDRIITTVDGSGEKGLLNLPTLDSPEKLLDDKDDLDGCKFELIKPSGNLSLYFEGTRGSSEFAIGEETYRYVRTMLVSVQSPATESFKPAPELWKKIRIGQSGRPSGEYESMVITVRCDLPELRSEKRQIGQAEYSFSRPIVAVKLEEWCTVKWNLRFTIYESKNGDGVLELQMQDDPIGSSPIMIERPEGATQFIPFKEESLVAISAAIEEYNSALKLFVMDPRLPDLNHLAGMGILNVDCPLWQELGQIAVK